MQFHKVHNSVFDFYLILVLLKLIAKRRLNGNFYGKHISCKQEQCIRYYKIPRDIDGSCNGSGINFDFA